MLHRHPEFVVFLNARDRHADPHLAFQVVLGDLSTHNTEHAQRWLRLHPRFRFHIPRRVPQGPIGWRDGWSYSTVSLGCLGFYMYVTLESDVSFKETDGCPDTDSRQEHAVHAALVSYGWHHVTHPDIPGTTKQADFKVEGTVWVEVFGFANAKRPAYVAEMEEKRKLLSARGPFVEFLPEDFDSKRGALTKKLLEIQEKLPKRRARLDTEAKRRKAHHLQTLTEFEASYVYALADEVAGPQLEAKELEIKTVTEQRDNLSVQLRSLQETLSRLYSEKEELIRPFR